MPAPLTAYVRTLCQNIANENDAALWSVLTRDRTLQQIGQEHFVSDQTLSRLRERFYLALDKWLISGEIYHILGGRSEKTVESDHIKEGVSSVLPVKRASKRKTPEKSRVSLNDGLQDAAGLAVRWMAQILDDPETGDELKYKCAMAILERVCAKATPLQDKDTDTALSVVLSKEVEKFAN